MHRAFSFIRSHPIRTLLIALIVGTFLGEGGLLFVGSKLLQPVPRQLGPPPPGATAVQLPTPKQRSVAGWLFSPPNGTEIRGSIVLAHGIRANRSVHISRARWFAEHGLHALAIDLQAHGESPGNRITLGKLESQDMESSVTWLRQQYPDTPVIALGQSLGGVSCLVGTTPGAGADFLILESVFQDLQTAVNNRMEVYLGKWARPAGYFLTAQLPLFLDMSPADIDPVRGISQVSAPCLIISGEEDQRATPGEAEALHRAASNSTLHLIPGAAHVDLESFDPEGYYHLISQFLDTHLPPR